VHRRVNDRFASEREAERWRINDIVQEGATQHTTYWSRVLTWKHREVIVKQ